jgi:DNA-binding NarL/FixJ family response regulator
MLVVEESDLALAVLGELDIGVLVCTAAIDRVLLSNAAAERMLAHLDGDEPLPAALRESVAEVLARHSPPGTFPAAVPLRSRAGCLFVRAKRLPDRDVALVVISGDVLRERDVAARFRLSKREAEIVELVCQGLSNDEIAERLNLTVLAVKHYLHGIFTALDVRTRSKLIAVVGGISRADS